MTATPLCGVFSSMTVKDGEEALATDTAKVDYEGMSILHCSACALVF
jgi:hypothetical protein